uniref:Uncharacterized protein n=1 Tax=Euplotes crassus TaxID=5936 RepID=A0A7S3KIH6_EUPCR|mmetsp:Transcript_29310/g.28923  ORF Transcript_29310/g.28923 Transcript_29310/m.28923 type:complete len:119 (+) Transcript_29310:190-546(+)
MKEIIEEGSISSKKTQREDSIDAHPFNQDSFERLDTENQLYIEDQENLLDKEESKQDFLEIPPIIESEIHNDTLVGKVDKTKILKRKTESKKELSIKIDEDLNLSNFEFMSDEKDSNH